MWNRRLRDDVSSPDSMALERDDTLSQRERLVLAQVLSGATSKEIARTLGVSPRTVEFHRANIMKKYGAKNSAELVRKVMLTPHRQG
jgi:DNA-binding CsgD family transcriptional regulator